MTELKKEELEKVNGGDAYLDEEALSYKKMTSREIDKYETEYYIGSNMFFERHYSQQIGTHTYSRYAWIYGTITRSYEKSNGCGTLRTAEVNVIASGGDQKHNGKEEICLDEWQSFI